MKNINKISQLFWNNKIKDKDPIDKLNGKLESFNLSIKSDELSYLYKITNNNILSQFSVISSIYSILLYKYFDNYVGIITSYNSLISSKDNNPFFLENNAILEKKLFKEHLQAISKEVQNNLAYAEYDSTLLNLDSYSNFAITLNSPLISEDKCKGVLLSFNITNEILELKVIYDESFVEKSLMQHFGLNFTKFLIHLQEFIDKDVNEFDFLTEKEKHKLLVEFNDTKVDYPKDKTIMQLFEKQVERTSENVAIVYEDTELTYRELNEEANQLGDYLRHNYNIQPDDLIAIKLERSERMIIAIVGILKSGAAYVPIDPSYPQERIDYIEKDTKAKVTIDNAFFETFESKKANYTKENLAIISKPNSLAYVIYTSGTTGQPKGVMIENSGLVNRLTWMQKAYPLNGLDTLIQKTTYTFDVSVWELLWWSVNGAKLSIPISGSEKDPAELIQNIYKNSVTVIHFVPSMLSVFLEFIKGDANQKAFLKTLKQVFVSGEALTLHQRKLFYNELPHISLMNLYGPTEASIDVSYYNCVEEHHISSIPIGKPIDNTCLYILNEKLDLIPIGVVGKLYISGAGLFRGYLNKDELTAEKFIENFFEEGAKMYDTGDLARWLPDGNIEFLGRKDSQVKMRGFRIELGEIENTIIKFSKDLNQVVVEVKENNKDKVLVAYFSSTSIIDKSALRNFLQSNLPDYMIPSFYVALERLPLTPNGKIDRKALPNIEGQDRIRREYIAPRTKTEEVLAAIWQEILDIDQIGITDNFFELGGHSLMVSQVINRIHKQLGKTVSFKMFFTNPIIKELSKQLIASEYLSIPKASEAFSYPLTASQSRFWVLSQLEGGSLAYNMPAAVKFAGKVDFYKFEKSFQLIINRHEILRTYFKTNEKGEVQQYILPSKKVAFEIIPKDFSTIENQEDEVANYLQEINNNPFDLEKAPLVRASLIKVIDEEYVFFLSLHHIIGDGWSIKLLLSEIVQSYNDLVAGRVINLPELSIQYKDYAVWLNEELHQKQYLASEKYWLKQLEGDLPVLDLPSFKKRPLVKTFTGDNISHKFSKDFLEKLKIFSKENDVTLFMTLMAGIKTLLYRYTGQDDIIIGTPIAGREHPDLEDLLGLFLNTLPIRTKFEKKSTFLDFVNYQKENLSHAYDNQNYPFDILLNKLNLKRDTSRSALFDVLVVLQNQDQLNNLNNEELSDIEVTEYEFENKTSKFDLTFTFTEVEGLVLGIDYNTDIYDLDFVERIFFHFENLLQQLINNPEREIQEIDYLTEVEKQQLLFDFNMTEVGYSYDETVLTLFEKQTFLCPNNIALIKDDHSITYSELNNKANKLARYLRKNNVQTGDNVAIIASRDMDMIVGMIAILKSGGAYVPIEPEYPVLRQKYIIENSNAKRILYDKDYDYLKEFNNDILIFINDPLIENESDENLCLIIEPSSLAYTIYTSGSSGNPKGVMIEHHSVVNLVEWVNKEFKVSKDDKLLFVTSFCFDLSVYDLFGILIAGGSIVIANEEQIRDFQALKKIMISEKITIWDSVPTTLKLLVDEILNYDITYKQLDLRLALMSGDWIPTELPTQILSCFPNCQNISLGGATEGTVWSNYYPIKMVKKDWNSIPYGKPIQNNTFYILDERMNLVPYGVIGELYIGGVGVARGYSGDKEKTENAFVKDPFFNKYGGRMYKTGDMGRMLSDNNMQFLGRKDNQVKINGFRIELEEIETALNKHELIHGAIILHKENKNKRKFLVAYILSEQELNVNELRMFLQQSLPKYMIPSYFMRIDNLPLNSNGKIDKKGLPEFNLENIELAEAKAIPRNINEKELVRIWADVLGYPVSKIGIDNDFFELGGDSVKAIKIFNLIKKNVFSDIKIVEMFEFSTIRLISDYHMKNIPSSERIEQGIEVTEF